MLNDTDAIAARIASIWLDALGRKKESAAFLKRLDSQSADANKYEDPELLEKALQTIPVHILYERASDKTTDDDELTDYVTRELLHWFKADYFKWVNEAPCDRCEAKTQFVGTARPTPEEANYGAGTVEMYYCHQCTIQTRFPRYNDPGKLLETRRGRCGEWANCFTLCCRAMGLDARIVHDTTDHVWTEVFSTFESRWVHCDPCEDAYDRPLIYEAGWNKQLAFCIAMSSTQAMDVTRRYVVDWTQTLGRRRSIIDETHLEQYLTQMRARKLAQLGDADRAMWIQRQKEDEVDLLAATERARVSKEDMIGRQSGSLAWRSQRGEQGTCSLPSELPREIDNDDALPSTVVSTCEMNVLGSALILPAAANAPRIARLTKDMNSQCGGMYLSSRLDLRHGFDMEFSFGMNKEQNGKPHHSDAAADGMAFVLQGNDKFVLGDGGCELGYGGLRNSIAIEFDTADRCDDPSGNHISVHGRLPPYANSPNHRYSLAHTSEIPALNRDISTHGPNYARVRYVASTRTLTVCLKQDGRFDNVLSVVVDINAYLNGQLHNCWLGFTAATGGLSQCHDVRIDALRRYTQ